MQAVRLQKKSPKNKFKTTRRTQVTNALLGWEFAKPWPNACQIASNVHCLEFLKSIGPILVVPPSCEDALLALNPQFGCSVLKVPKWFPNFAQVEAPSMPIDRFRTSKIKRCISKVTAIREAVMENNIQKPMCLPTLRQKTKELKHSNISKSNQAAQRAQHGHHHPSIFPRAGANDRGRSNSDVFGTSAIETESNSIFRHEANLEQQLLIYLCSRSAGARRYLCEPPKCHWSAASSGILNKTMEARKCVHNL